MSDRIIKPGLSSEVRGWLTLALIAMVAIVAVVIGVSITSIRGWEQETILRKACIEAGGTVIDVARSHHCLAPGLTKPNK